jgi:uncharacterized membrane protein YeaQ/YmgE (transglycosylase-associated protein family)
MKWKPLMIGAVIGAIAGMFMSGKGKGANPLGITGSMGRPFQYRVDPGKNVRGG